MIIYNPCERNHSQFAITKEYFPVVNERLKMYIKWTIRGSNPGGGDIFRTFPERP